MALWDFFISTNIEVFTVRSPMASIGCIYYHGLGFNCESQLEEVLRESLPLNPEHRICYTTLERWSLLLQNMPVSHEEMFYVSLQRSGMYFRHSHCP